MKIQVLESAKNDIREAYWFYHKQEKGLGAYFKAIVKAEIESLRATAGVHAKQFGLHRTLTRTFPYAIYYDKKGETVIVHAVLDLRRCPEWIEERLK